MVGFLGVLTLLKKLIRWDVNHLMFFFICWFIELNGAFSISLT